jgi:hypothetical protein
MKKDSQKKEEIFEKKNIFIPNNLRAFISYSEENKKIASGIKENLNRFGVQAFLAHDDIPPGKDWASEILKNLRNTDIFIALLTQDFIKSKWTDQEAGIAICLDKFIIPISLDGTLPYGFIEKYQAFKNFKYEFKNYVVNIRTMEEKEFLDCKGEIYKIIEFISKEENFKENLADSLITSLENVSSFRQAESYFELLIKLEPFSEGQINKIVEISIKNRQIYDAHGCQDMLKNLLKKYSNSIEESNRKTIEEKISV